MILGWRPSALMPWLVQGQKCLQQVFVVSTVVCGICVSFVVSLKIYHPHYKQLLSSLFLSLKKGLT